MRLTATIFALATIFGALNASATTVYLDAVDGVQDSKGNNVGPYIGRLDNTSYAIFCDDFNHNIGVPDSEVVNVSTINDLSKTRFGTLAAATSLYQQVFYLASYLAGANKDDRADIQDAQWSYFSADAPNQNKTAVKAWEAKAAANYQNKDYSGFRILTDASNQFNGKQELFIMTTTAPPGLTSTPEPGTWAMLATGFGGLLAARLRRKKA